METYCIRTSGTCYCETCGDALPRGFDAPIDRAGSLFCSVACMNESADAWRRAYGDDMENPVDIGRVRNGRR